MKGKGKGEQLAVKGKGEKLVGKVGRQSWREM